MLTPRKKTFADYWFLTKNASEASRQAGYSVNTAGQSGSRLLKDKYVKEYLAELDAKEQEKISSIREERTKDKFVDTAWKEYEKQENPPAVRVRALEIAGRSLGHLKNDSDSVQIIIGTDALESMRLSLINRGKLINHSITPPPNNTINIPSGMSESASSSQSAETLPEKKSEPTGEGGVEEPQAP